MPSRQLSVWESLSLLYCLRLCASVPGSMLLETGPGRQLPGAVAPLLSLCPLCPGRPAPQVSSGVLRSSRGTAFPGVSGLLPADRPETGRGRPCTGEQPWRGQRGYAGPCGASVFCAGPGGWGSFCSVGLRPSGTVQRQGAQQTPTASHAWILGRGPRRFFWFWG